MMHGKLRYLGGWGMIAALWLLLFAHRDIEREVRSWWHGSTWISATLEILPQTAGPPKILYDADPKFAVDATWVASVRDEDGGHIFNPVRGQGDYAVADDQPKAWPWQAFFEGRMLEPSVPYRVCVRYRKEAEDRRRDSPEFCSSLYDPITRTVIGSI